MKKDKLKAFKSAIKIQQDYGLDDSQMDELIVPEMIKRERGYKKAVAHRYGASLYEAATKWWQSLSPREQRKAGENAEQIIQSYIVNNPNEVTSADIAKGVGRDKLKWLIHDGTFDEIGPPVIDEEGKIRPGKKIKIEKKPPREPTQAELKKMSLQEIAERIREIRDYRWPSGGGEEIRGLDGVEK